MTTEQKNTALKIAKALDDFAEEMDPYGYIDYVDEFCHGSREKSVQTNLQDLLSRNTDYLLEWLEEIMTDELLPTPDRAYAEHLYDKLSDWVDETRITKGE